MAGLQYKRLHKKVKCHLIYLSEEIIKVLVQDFKYDLEFKKELLIWVNLVYTG